MIDKIKENLKKVLQDIEDRFDDKNYVEPPPSKWDDYVFEQEPDDNNPYEGASWGSADNWHCIRCGSHLREIDEKDPSHGAACYSDMRKHGTLYYQCSNKECCHYNAPLTLHHPMGGPSSPAGESYSISWVR